LAKPEADAVIVTDPLLTPVTVISARRATVVPSGITKADGETIALVASLLASVIATPPPPAGDASVTGRVTISPVYSERVAGTIRVPPCAGGDVVLAETVTLAAALA
jgi:hypothetical protein